MSHTYSFLGPAHHFRLVSGMSLGMELLQTTILRLSHASILPSGGLQNTPTCSVYFGASGIAYMFYRLSKLWGDTHHLFVASTWAGLARYESLRQGAFYSDELSITDQVAGPASLYYHASGANCVQALISYAMDDLDTFQGALEDFASASEHSSEKLDLTSGSSGTLMGCTLLLEVTGGARRSNTTPIIELGNKVVQRIWSQIDTFDSIVDCTYIPFLGIAHGWAGIIYSTLRWCQAADSALPVSLEKRLYELAACSEDTGNGVRWRRRPRCQDDQVAWPGWCHGSAGYVHLWTLAHHVFHDETFLLLAERAAWNVWETFEKHGSSLCCGLTGQAYALLNLYKYVQDKRWLDFARTLGERAALDTTPSMLRSNSLFKGRVGVALLAADLLQPELSCMPLFEPEPWTTAPPQ